MLLLQTLFFGLIFLLLSGTIFYSIGFGILSSKLKDLEDQDIITLGLSIGLVVFVLCAILFGVLHLRWAVLPLVALASALSIYKSGLKILTPWKSFFKDRILLTLIILGILTQGFINFPSGYLYGGDLHFWSSQGHDGLWHVSVMEEIKKSFPPQNPGFSNTVVYNYHYLVDVLMGEFARIFPFFSSLDLYFRYFPVIFSFLMGISVFAFVSKWKENRYIGYLAIFFTYFVGSFGYIASVLRGGNFFSGETAFWAAQQNTLLGNPPHAISHGLLASFFLSFLIYLKKRNKFWAFISFLIVATLAGFKVSGGFVLLVGLGAAALVDLIVNRKILTLVLTGALGLSNFITFKLMTKDAASFLMFLPWWFIRVMIVDKLGLIEWEHRRQHYLSVGRFTSYLRVGQLELTAFLIFLIGNLGMRFLGFLELINMAVKGKLKSIKDPMNVLLTTSMFTGLIIPIFFVQKGLIYNNIQFMQYFLFIFGFFGAVSTYKILKSIKSKQLKIIFFLLIAALSLPTVIGNLREFYGPKTSPLSRISNQELSALKYLKENSKSDAIILNLPFNKYLRDKFKSQILPMYAWYDTDYISAIAGRSSYLASEHVTLLFYPQTQERIDNKSKFFQQSDLIWNKQFLKDEKISYVYIPKKEIETVLDVEGNGLKNFFENEEVTIYSVQE